MIGAVPDATTEKDAGEAAHTVCGVGFVVTAASVFTVRIAAALVAFPHELVTTQSYDPASAASAEAIASVADVAPGTLTEFFLHWYVNGAEPDPTTLSDAGEPTHVVWGDGLVPMVAGVFTVSAAAELVWAPQGLVMTQSYEPASVVAAAGME